MKKFGNITIRDWEGLTGFRVKTQTSYKQILQVITFYDTNSKVRGLGSKFEITWILKHRCVIGQATWTFPIDKST